MFIATPILFPQMSVYHFQKDKEICKLETWKHCNQTIKYTFPHNSSYFLGNNQTNIIISNDGCFVTKSKWHEEMHSCTTRRRVWIS